MPYPSLRRHRRPQSVSREIVVWAYQRLLGREPESEDVISEKMHLSSPFAVINAILDRPEYAARTRYMDSYAGPLEVEWRVEPDVAAAMLAHISERWRQLGEKCPYWSVLAGPEYLSENTAEQQQVFYDSGADDVRMLLATLSRVGRRPEEFPGGVRIWLWFGSRHEPSLQAFLPCDRYRHLALAPCHSASCAR